MKTNSNSYTIIYSVIIVVALDKKKQILNSLNIRDLNDAQADAKYKEVVVADRVIDEKGKVLLPGTSGGENAGFKLESKDYKEGKLALYICRVNGETKYVVPVYGMGLWGPISGYIALNADKSTVYGVYFNHESETAGLGAEIKDNKAWQEKFQGKKLFKNGDDKAIALSVEKKVEDPTTQVDAVTGATLTSNGVRDMLHEALGKYLVFINQK